MLTSTKWEYKSLHCCSPQNKVIILLLSCQCKEPGTAERGGGGGAFLVRRWHYIFVSL